MYFSLTWLYKIYKIYCSKIPWINTLLHALKKLPLQITTNQVHHRFNAWLTNPRFQCTGNTIVLDGNQQASLGTRPMANPSGHIVSVCVGTGMPYDIVQHCHPWSWCLHVMGVVYRYQLGYGLALSCVEQPLELEWLVYFSQIVPMVWALLNFVLKLPPSLLDARKVEARIATVMQ